MSVKFQNQFWSGLAKVDPDSAIIDHRDRLGFKNSYICQLRNDAFLRHLPLDSDLYCMDFGCGSGLVTEFLDSQGFRALGVDINPDLLKFAAERTTTRNYELVQYDGVNLPFADGALGSACSYVVLGYLDDECLHQVLKDFARILRPGGKLVLIEQVAVKRADDLEGAKIQRTAQEYHEALQLAGFEKLRLETLRYSKFLLTYFIRYGLLK